MKILEFDSKFLTSSIILYLPDETMEKGIQRKKRESIRERWGQESETRRGTR